jgi:hypothetical protein
LAYPPFLDFPPALGSLCYAQCHRFRDDINRLGSIITTAVANELLNAEHPLTSIIKR